MKSLQRGARKGLCGPSILRNHESQYSTSSFQSFGLPGHSCVLHIYILGAESFMYIYVLRLYVLRSGELDNTRKVGG